MGKETKIGLAVIVVLLGVFGGVLFKRLQSESQAALQAKAKEAPGPAKNELAEPRKFASGPLKPNLVTVQSTGQSTGQTPEQSPAGHSSQAGGRWSPPATNASGASNETANSYSPPGRSYGNNDRYATSGYGSTGQGLTTPPAQPTRASYEPAQTNVTDRAPQTSLSEAQATDSNTGAVAADSINRDPFNRDPINRGASNSGQGYPASDANASPSTGTAMAGDDAPPTQGYVPPGERGNPLRYGGADTSAAGQAGSSPTVAGSPSAASPRGPAGYDVYEPGSRYSPPATSIVEQPSYTPPDSPRDSRNTISAAQDTSSSSIADFLSRPRPTAPKNGDDAFHRGKETYVVAPNDNYWTISEKVYGTGGYFKALHEHNRERHPRADRLQTGDVVSTPSADALTQTYPNLCPKPERVQQQQRSALFSSQRRQHTGRVYVVEEGDTLFDIARYELGKASRWAEIYDLNKDLIGADFNHLKPGAELIMPAGEPPDTLTRRPANHPAR